MKLYFKQKLFSWGDKFFIYDYDGNEIYYVVGEVFTLGKKLHLYDMHGEELAYIEQQLTLLLPRYVVYQKGEELAEIVKEFTFLRNRYTVEGPGWEVEGELFIHDYRIVDGDRVIASIEKEWFTLGDAYEITFGDTVDGPTMITALSVVLVIDACIDAQK